MVAHCRGLSVGVWALGYVVAGREYVSVMVLMEGLQ